METKILGSFVLSIFIVAMLGVFVSADFAFTSVTGDTQSVVQGNTATVSFELVENNSSALSLINFNVPINLVGPGNDINSATTVTNAITTLVQNTTSTVSMSLTFNVPSNQAVGVYTGSLAPTAIGGSLTTPLAITLTVTSPPLNEPVEVAACSAIGNPGELKVKDIDFNNLGSLIFKEVGGNIYFELGDDDEWFPLDELEVDIEIENNGKEDVDDIEVEWGLYNTKRNEMVIDFDEEDEVNIRDGKDEIITAKFNLEDELDVDLDDLDDGKNYRFYVIATGDVDDGASPTTRTCVSGFENVEIIIENDFVVLNDVQFPEIVQCGENVQISAKVWNIGEDDQDEVKVEVHNNALGLFHKTTEIGDIDAFDDDGYNFNFRVPDDAEEKIYSLVFSVLDEDFDVYENDFDDDDSKFTLPFKVSGGCSEEAAVSISVNLESGGKAGEELVVRVIVTNTGDDSADYLVNAAGFSLWASSANVNPTAFTLNSGQSRDVLITLNVRDDASGDEVFDLEVLSGNELVARQPVSVLVEGRGGFLTGGVIGAFGGGSTYLWLLGLLNIILVIVIIVVAVRALRK